MYFVLVRMFTLRGAGHSRCSRLRCICMQIIWLVQLLQIHSEYSGAVKANCTTALFVLLLFRLRFYSVLRAKRISLFNCYSLHCIAAPFLITPAEMCVVFSFRIWHDAEAEVLGTGSRAKRNIYAKRYRRSRGDGREKENILKAINAAGVRAADEEHSFRRASGGGIFRSPPEQR